MSAIGAVPGYAYPSFDYAESEFALISQPAVTAAGGGFIVAPLITADSNGAIFLREATCTVGTSAVPGTRTIALQLDDPAGNLVNRYNSPSVLTASVSVTNQWSVGISAAYSAGGAGYSPIGGIVIPPGYFWILVLLNCQAGDTISFINGSGLRIPAGRTDDAAGRLLPTPLLT